MNACNLQIEKMTLQDLTKIGPILCSDFDEFWTLNTLKEELENSNSYFLVAKLEKEIIGFAGLKQILEEADIMNIVVKKTFRNQRVGSILLDALINLAKELHLTNITLEVHEENLPALHLYEKFGFEKKGIRKNYYPNHKNAILMAKKLG